jgi:hypothetical protein
MHSKPFRQFRAIVKMEATFTLRRSAPLVMTALIGVIVSVGMLMMPISMIKDWSPANINSNPDLEANLAARGYTLDEYYDQLVYPFVADWSTVAGAPMSWIFMAMALVFMPIATISIIPADRRFGVMELIRSTPVTALVYLAGKACGVLLVVLLTAAGVFLLFLGALEVVSMAYLHVSISVSVLVFYLRLTLIDGLPMLASGTLIGTLFGVFFKTRRGAIFPGFLIGLASLWGWLSAFKPPTTRFPQSPDIAAYFVFQTYHSEAISRMLEFQSLPAMGLLGESAPPIGIMRVFLMYLMILIALLGLVLGALGWLRWKENFK